MRGREQQPSRLYAALLLEWSRSLPEHNLDFDTWVTKVANGELTAAA